MAPMGDSPLAESRRHARRPSHFFRVHHPPQADRRIALPDSPKVNRGTGTRTHTDWQRASRRHRSASRAVVRPDATTPRRPSDFVQRPEPHGRTPEANLRVSRRCSILVPRVAFGKTAIFGYYWGDERLLPRIRRTAESGD